MQGHRGDQELRYWPPPRGWVDPQFMTRLYQRNRGAPGGNGMFPPLFGQGVARSFSEPPHTLVDFIEQGWMGEGGHAPGQPQPPPNAAAVARELPLVHLALNVSACHNKCSMKCSR